ncbi:MAG TPA: diguanylate cyclase [Candidatus Binatia bacterium]|nr:diguanylate cyclase [Candidatus Binatia bacterium]
MNRAPTASTPPRQRLDALLDEAEDCNRRGSHRDGAVAAGHAAELAVELRDSPRRVHALQLLGLQLFRIGEIESSARTCQVTVQLCEQLGDWAGVADAQCVQAMACVELGLHDEALQAVTGALDAARRNGDRTRLCWAYNRFGVVHEAMGNHAQSAQLLDDALQLAIEINDPQALFAALNNAAETAISLVRHHRGRGELDAAQRALRAGTGYAEQGLEMARDSGNFHSESICLGNLGMLQGLGGDYELAFATLAQSEQLAREHGYRPLLLMAAMYSAELLRQRGDLAAAIEHIRELLRLAGSQADKVLLLRAQLELSRACRDAGDYRGALEAYEAYHGLERELNSAVAETRARMLMNRLELDNAKLEAERARLEAEVQRLRSTELEAEKHVLQERTVELDRRANEDPLTGLWNRRFAEDTLPVAFAEARASGRPLSIALVDIDYFKSINDRFGHATGDLVLQKVATLLRNGCRATDAVARVGGEEFLLMLVDTSMGAARGLCERLRRQVETCDWKPIQDGMLVTISIGVAQDGGAAERRDLLAEADRRLYEAKRGGRNRVEPAGD